MPAGLQEREKDSASMGRGCALRRGEEARAAALSGGFGPRPCHGGGRQRVLTVANGGGWCVGL